MSSKLLSRFFRLASPSVAILISLAGCGSENPENPYVARNAAGNLEEAVAPGAHGPAAGGWAVFYPLDMGNRWEYSHPIEANFLDLDGRLVDTIEIDGSDVYEITGTEELFGRTYVIQEENWRQSSPMFGDDEGTYWIRTRQDRTGLYEADVSINDPPGSAGDLDRGDALRQYASRLSPKSVPPDLRPAWQRMQEKRAILLGLIYGGAGLSGQNLSSAQGDSLSNELIRLDYPLHPGMKWAIREEPLVMAEVLGHEVVDVPAGRFPAWRIQITWPQFDMDDDEIYYWYGSSGMLKLYFHSLSDWTSETGEALGTFDWLETMDLTGIDLQAGGGPAGAVASR